VKKGDSGNLSYLHQAPPKRDIGAPTLPGELELHTDMNARVDRWWRSRIWDPRDPPRGRYPDLSSSLAHARPTELL